MNEIQKIVRELRKELNRLTLRIYENLNRLRKALKKQLKKEPNMKEIHNEVKDFMSYDQVAYYLRIRFMIPELRKYLMPNHYARICYANIVFTKKEWQEKLIDRLKGKKLDLRFGGKGENLSLKLKEEFPELRDNFDKIAFLFQTIYNIKSMRKYVKLNYPKLSEFERLKLYMEWTETKNELNKLIKKPNSKKIWTVGFCSDSGLSRAKKSLKGGVFDRVERKNAIRVEEKTLLDNLHLFRRFHCKIY